MKNSEFLTVIATSSLLLITVSCNPQTTPSDNFDYIDRLMKDVDANNCAWKSSGELHLPIRVPQLPRYDDPIRNLPNRTNLWHIHNQAMSRAIYFSFIYQKLNDSTAADFLSQPGLLYFYMSTSADVSAGEKVGVSSGIMFDNNSTYANWYRNLPFNQTLPLFGPRSWKLAEATNSPIRTEDYGAGPNKNYTETSYKINRWYDIFLPDKKPWLDSRHKQIYKIGIKYSNGTGEFASDKYTEKSIYGPTLPTDRDKIYPVEWTEPFFDCGRSNQWIVSAVSPIVDIIPRYQPWWHMRRSKFVAVAVLDVPFAEVDFNPCPLGIGNELPNFFHDIAKCKKTTECAPLSGWGFKRGGYSCSCKKGFVYPPGQNGPFMGADIEEATEEEHEEGFDCIPSEGENDYYNLRSASGREDRKGRKIDREERQNTILEEAVDSLLGMKLQKRQKFVSRHSGTLPEGNQRIDSYHYDVADIEGNSALSTPTKQDSCEMETTFGGYSNQAKTALRLAHFLSHFMQNVDEYEVEVYSVIREERLLIIDQLFGEVIANVFGDLDIKGSGIFYDANKFQEPESIDAIRQYFGPYAFRPVDVEVAGFDVLAVDSAGFEEPYVDSPWFKDVKNVWEYDITDRLTRFTHEALIRSDLAGTNLTEYSRYPFYFKAVSEDDVTWSIHHFHGDEREERLLSASVPFFGFKTMSSSLEFKGVVRVDIALENTEDVCSAD